LSRSDIVTRRESLFGAHKVELALDRRIVGADIASAHVQSLTGAPTMVKVGADDKKIAYWVAALMIRDGEAGFRFLGDA
jgi:hypothetical protein